ncbi:MAG: hypothetical protein PHI63_05360 [Patescibacteria group bacterium]|nr:hypothetical protein [Patescibacteria group bacterium]
MDIRPSAAWIHRARPPVRLGKDGLIAANHRDYLYIALGFALMIAGFVVIAMATFGVWGKLAGGLGIIPLIGSALFVRWRCTWVCGRNELLRQIELQHLMRCVERN